MKQSNIDYRQTYFFNGFSKRDEKNSPSIFHDPDINTSINENPYRSNVEIEKGEVVLRPELDALHKATGKKHTQGGTDVYLPEGSFIFSDDKALAFDKNDYNLFELKQGGTKKKLNTPAQVVQKNVDLEHYNSMMAILNDPTKDKVAKDTAAAMLQKYLPILGNIAYVQEKKKGLPQGVPDFAQGTAPVYDDGLKDNIDENKQYMKYGGSISNPYKMQRGGSSYTPSGGSRDALSYPVYPKKVSHPPVVTAPSWGLWQGDKLPTFSNIYGVNNAADKINNLDYLANQLGYTGPKDNKSFQQWLYNSSPENKNIIDQWHNDYNVGPTDGMFDGKIGIRWANAIRDILTPRTTYIQPKGIDHPIEPIGQPTIDNPYRIAPGKVTGDPQNGIPVNWKFTPWQKQSQLYNAMKWADVSREMPYRSHYNATYADPSLVNPEQTIADTKGMANMQMNSADLQSPILANAQKAAAYGDFLDRVPGIRSQYDNQNVGIQNQFRQYNNQIKNEETLRNMGNDQNYWRDAAIGRQNFRNMRGYLGDQFMNNRMQDVQDNQSLAYQMLTLGPKPAYGFDWNSGNFYRNDKNILDVQNSAQSDLLTQTFSKYLSDPNEFSKLDPRVQAAIVKSATLKGLPLNNYKKGGMFKNPYKK